MRWTWRSGHLPGEVIRLERVRCEAKESAMIIKTKKPRRNERIWQSALSERISKYSASNLLLTPWLGSLLHRSTQPLFLAGPQSRQTGRARIPVDASRCRGRKGPLRFGAERCRRGRGQPQFEKNSFGIFAINILRNRDSLASPGS